MATKKSKTVIMQDKDYRKPDSFIYYTGREWKDFLARWNDSNITNDEAMGLLHTVTERLHWTDSAFESDGEDSRETCVRFLLYYASHPYQYDIEWQIIEKARKVLINKVLSTSYIRDKAPDELIIDILNFFIKNIRGCIQEDNTFYEAQPQRRKIEDFLKMVYKTRKKKNIDECVNKLVSLLFRGKDRILVL